MVLNSRDLLCIFYFFLYTSDRVQNLGDGLWTSFCLSRVHFAFVWFAERITFPRKHHNSTYWGVQSPEFQSQKYLCLLKNDLLISWFGNGSNKSLFGCVSALSTIYDCRTWKLGEVEPPVISMNTLFANKKEIDVGLHVQLLPLG